jgi:hypothetical protein
MHHRLLVVDQSYLRSPELERVLSDNSNRVVLPDLGFFEMAKGEEAEPDPVLLGA